MSDTKRDVSEMLLVGRKIDEFGFTPTQFRVLANISRRGECHAAVRTIAEDCRIRTPTVRKCVRFLEAHSVILVERVSGCTNRIRIRPFNEWEPLPKEDPTQTDTRVSKDEHSSTKSGDGGLLNGAGTPLPKEGSQRKPLEGNPIKKKKDSEASRSETIGEQESPFKAARRELL